MRQAFMVAVLLLATASVGARAAETTTDTAPKAKHAGRPTHAKPAHAKAAKTQPTSPEQRRDLERRIEALEQKYEMQPAAEPGAK